MELNPRQFVQPMLGNMREDYPLMPEGGTTLGDETQPIYRMVRLPSEIGANAANDEERMTSILDEVRRGGGDYHRRGGGLGLHWSHDLLEEQDVAAEFRQDPSFQTVAIEADHPGRDSVMDWGNPDDHPILEQTVIPEEAKDFAIPEVPVRPGASMRLRALHFQEDPTDGWHSYDRRVAFDTGRHHA